VPRRGLCRRRLDWSKWSDAIADARQLDIPGITAIVLEELQDRIATGMSHDHPVPIYRMLHKVSARTPLSFKRFPSFLDFRLCH
jgi:hypothetical protein